MCHGGIDTVRFSEDALVTNEVHPPCSRGLLVPELAVSNGGLTNPNSVKDRLLIGLFSLHGLPFAGSGTAVGPSAVHGAYPCLNRWRCRRRVGADADQVIKTIGVILVLGTGSQTLAARVHRPKPVLWHRRFSSS